MLDMPEPKVIYSKRYPSWDDELKDLKDNPSGNGIAVMPKESLNENWKKLMARWDHMVKNSVYVLQPEKMNNLGKYINLAIKFSSDYEISIEITDHFYYTSVTLCFFCCTLGGDFISMFSELLGMSDKISSFMPKDESCDFIVILDYFTHDHYVEGAKLDY